MFITKYKKGSIMSHSRINPSFLFHLHQGIMTNEHEYVTKMAQNATMGDLWEDFIAYDNGASMFFCAFEPNDPNWP